MKMKKKFRQDGSALAIVAHPDDETIWCGGFIMKYPQFNWTIFSLCRASDRNRAPKFRRVCRQYRAQAVITDLEDDGRLTIKQTLPLIKKLILKKIGRNRFDLILTHGANGEYGHDRHKGVQQTVKRLVEQEKLNTKRVLYFNYAKQGKKKFSPPVARKNSDLKVELTAEQLARKKWIMTELYGFASDGIDVSYCTSPEAFRIIKIQNPKISRLYGIPSRR